MVHVEVVMGPEKWIDKLWCCLAWLLPRGLVRECGWRIAAHATLGDIERLDKVTIGEALSRWDSTE